MAKRLFSNKLVLKNDIKEELRLINGSLTDYITPSGQIYKDYGNNLFYHKKTHISTACGYTYCGITYPDGQKSRRVHILVAEAYIPNPNKFPYVGHKNNIKHQTDVNNLYWTTASENTQKAFDDGLAKNAKGFEDSQSIPIDVYDVDGNYIETCGSGKETARKYHVSASTVFRQSYKISKKSKTGFVFRFQGDTFVA